MPTVRKGHVFRCGNCHKEIPEGEDYYTAEGDIFGYCFRCSINPAGHEDREKEE